MIGRFAASLRGLESEATLGSSLLTTFSPCCCAPPKSGAVEQSASSPSPPPRIPSVAFLSDNDDEKEAARGRDGLKTASSAARELPTVELALPNHSRMTQTPKYGLFQVPKVRWGISSARWIGSFIFLA